MALRAASSLTVRAYSRYCSNAALPRTVSSASESPCSAASDVAVGRAHGVLHERDRLGVPHVVLAVAPPRVDPADRQQPRGVDTVAHGCGRPGARVALQRLGRQHLEADSADARGGAGEVPVDQRRLETDRLEDLRAAVGLDRGDAHLGDRLQQPFADRLDTFCAASSSARPAPRCRSCARIDVCDPSVEDQPVERLEHQIRVDRARAIAEQRGEVVHLARLARLEDDPGAQARALAHEVVVDGGHRQQRWNRRAARPHQPIGEDDDVDALGDRVVRLRADARERRVDPRGPLARPAR